MIAALILAAAAASLPDAGWSHRDFDLGRAYQAADGSGAIVLVAKVYPGADDLPSWFAPRAGALAGYGVEAQLIGEKRAHGKILRDIALAAQGAPLLEVSAAAYATPAGMQIIVIANPEGKRSAEAAAFLTSHMNAGDIWTGEDWEASSTPPPMESGLSCRLEQVPSVVWTFERDCTGGACRLEPDTAMTLVEQTVCR